MEKLEGWNGKFNEGSPFVVFAVGGEIGSDLDVRISEGSDIGGNVPVGIRADFCAQYGIDSGLESGYGFPNFQVQEILGRAAHLALERGDAIGWRHV